MSIAGKTIDGISFGPFVLDTKGRRLIRDGRRVPVTPIELKLLETLLRHRGSVLTGGRSAPVGLGRRSVDGRRSRAGHECALRSDPEASAFARR